MENNKYIDIIINIITGTVKEDSLDRSITLDYFANLFPEILDSIKIVIKANKLPLVDDITLKSYYETAKKQYLSVNPIDIEPSSSLTKEGFKTWLDADRKNQMKDSWNYSNRYFALLEKSGRSELVVEETKKTSLEILEKIGDPKSTEAFYNKGLVVGSVQAGKTQNFNAVINRAIDAGYGLIIVLAGLMEDLRNQTQLRIENDVVGEGINLDTGTIVNKGVGKIRKFGNLGDNSVTQVISITSAKSDFKKSLLDADFSLNQTNILICKKNISVLRNLIVWLYDYLEENKDQHNIPLLVLDDEADNASLNNEGKKGIEYASKTNGHIRALLALFKRKTYLGYTATPFANVLADRNEAPENNWIIKYKVKDLKEEIALPRVDNLFPEDFIVLLNPPTNYVGAKYLFDTVDPIENEAQLKIPLVEIVNDHIENFPHRVYPQEDGTLLGVEKIKNKDEWKERFGYGSYMDFDDYSDYRRKTRASRQKDGFPKHMPDSIKESIQCFILVIAIRASRDGAMNKSTLYNPHNSMLIHISRYSLWQITLKKLIDDYIKEIQRRLQMDDPNDPGLIYSTFEKTWNKYYSFIIEQISKFLPRGYKDEFMKPISFNAIKNNFLEGAVKSIEVKAINSITKDNLIYPLNSPKKYIAIGGNRLSRGFTLEGLSINYFVRSTDYSDTLLQMGRWFGYRPGYLDCCKLFITPDAVDNYNLVTRTIEELEGEFKKMEEKGRTPRDFILRVKKHPGALKITRPAILKDVKTVNWSYQDTLEQTTKIEVTKQKIENVWTQFRKNIVAKYTFKKKLSDDGNDSGFIIAETTIDEIINILQQESNFGKETCKSLVKFLDRCKEVNKLNNWTIAIKTTGAANEDKGKGKLKQDESGLPFEIDMTIRRGPEEGESTIKYRKEFIDKKIFGVSGKSANLISSGLDLSILLSKSQIKDAEKEFIEDRKKYYKRKYPTWNDVQVSKKANDVTMPERIYREKMSDKEGLLLIYLLDSYYVFLQEKGKEDTRLKEFVNDENIDLNIPLVGYAIGFPPIEPDPGGEYVYGDYGIDDDDDDDDDDENNDNDNSELPTDANDE